MISGKKKKSERKRDVEISTQGTELIPTKMLLPALGMSDAGSWLSHPSVESLVCRVSSHLTLSECEWRAEEAHCFSHHLAQSHASLPLVLNQSQSHLLPLWGGRAGEGPWLHCVSSRRCRAPVGCLSGFSREISSTDFFILHAALLSHDC